MAALNELPGAFVLEVAKLGAELIASFTKFITSRKIRERRMENILATLSITTSLLTDLGTTINKYEKYAYIGDDVTRPTCETCKADLERLLVISKEAGERGLWVREGTLGGKPVSAEIDPWFLFNIGLGGQVESAEFFKRLNATRYSLSALNDTVHYKIFKALKEQGRLDPEQTEELKNLTALLPQLVKTIERAEKNKAEKLAWEAEKVEKALKSSRNRRDVGQKDEAATPILERKDSDNASELTMIESPQVYLKKKNNQFTDDYDCQSVCSVDSMDESNFLPTKEVLEEWRLRWTDPRKDIRGSVSLLGMKLKRYDEDSGYWGIDPELRSQNELKDALLILTSNTPHTKYRDSVDKAMKALPQEAREAVEDLLEDRQMYTSNENHTRLWTVVAVRSKVKNHFGTEWFKSVKSQDWLVMIKGETLDHTKRTWPNRRDDPWRKPQPRARRYPIYDDYYDREYRRAQLRPLPPVRYPSPTPMPLLEDNRHRRLTEDAEIDGFRPGTIVVGEVSNHEEAEKKMNEILTDLPGKFIV